MGNIKTKHDDPKNKGEYVNKISSGDNTPLPVLDICNNLLTISGYISAIESATLPNIIVKSNPTLATKYEQWQTTIWQIVFQSLINDQIFAQAEEIYNFINEGITDQSVFQNVISKPGNPVPTVISVCDDVEGYINSGLTYLNQIQTIANGIQGADQNNIANLQQIINTLNTQFDNLEQKITDKAIDNGKDVVATIIDVGVAVATEEQPISPLCKGISQVGFDIIKELILSDEIQTTLTSLESAWNQFDQATLELAKITLILNQLNTITGDSNPAINALNNIVNDWQTICNLINNDTPKQWTKTGLSKLTEWADRMNRVQFYGNVSQTVTPSS